MKNRKLQRKQNFDYNEVGSYFITICSFDRKKIFSEVKNDKSQLNSLGETIEEYWKRIPQHFDDVAIGEYVIMPNHIHGIIHLLPDQPIYDLSDLFADTVQTVNTVGTADLLSLRGKLNDAEYWQKRTQMKLSRIIQQFKSSVSRDVEKKNVWQRSFHDRIIRNETELHNIKNYITHNPQNWGIDKNNI